MATATPVTTAASAPAVSAPAPAGAALPVPRESAGLWSDAWRRLRSDWVTIGAVCILLVMVVLALAADLLAEHLFKWGFTRQDLLRTWEPPSLAEPAFWLGG